MNIDTRLARLEQQLAAQGSEESMPRAHNAPIRKWEPDCICFPYKPDFRGEDELLAVSALKCPLHGSRFSDYDLFYRAAWLPEDSRWAYAPEHARGQFEKAWRATFPKAEST